MDFRGVLDRATDRVKSVFSRDNSFFYGTAAREDRQAIQGYEQGPQQGVYPNAYQQQSAYVSNYQEYPEQAEPRQQGYQTPHAPWQQPHAQVPQQPTWQQPYQNTYKPNYQQPAPQAAYQQPQQFVAPQQQQARGYTSPQHAQLQQQAPEVPGRNRRAAQHQQAPEPSQDNNVVPFPGASMPETPELRQVDAYVVNITNINGCRQAMTCLRKGQCTLVVMDQLVDKAEVRRYVDMLNGACFALGGTMTRLSLKVGFYILAPSGMMVYTDPITASANAQPRPHPASGAAAQGYPHQGQQPAYAMPQDQQAPQPQRYQAGAYAPPVYNQQGSAYTQPLENYDTAFAEDRYAQ